MLFLLRYSQTILLKPIVVTNLFDFHRVQIFVDPMIGASLAKSTEMLGVTRSTVLKLIICFRKSQIVHVDTSLEESQTIQIGTIVLLHEWLERITIIQSQSYRSTTRTTITRFTQNLFAVSCLHSDLLGRKRKNQFRSITNVATHLDQSITRNNWSLDQFNHTIISD